MQKSLKTPGGILVPQKEKVLVEGVYTLSKCDVKNSEARRMVHQIEEIARLGRARIASAPLSAVQEIRAFEWAKYREILEAFYSKFLIYQTQVPAHNLVVNNGLEMLARIISGDVVYTGVINYCTLGDSNTAVAAGQTTLGSEVHRKLVTSATFSAGEAFISTFFNQTEIVDTIEEIGHVVDGTASADTGQMYSRIEAADTTELPVTKSITETLTVDYKSTFANS